MFGLVIWYWRKLTRELIWHFQSTKRPSICSSSIVKSSLNPFLEPTSTKPWVKFLAQGNDRGLIWGSCSHALSTKKKGKAPGQQKVPLKTNFIEQQTTYAWRCGSSPWRDYKYDKITLIAVEEDLLLTVNNSYTVLPGSTNILTLLWFLLLFILILIKLFSHW